MEYKKLATMISIAAVSMLAAHLAWPDLGIDATSIALLVLVFFPWLIPVLKSVELPGGVKIELKDTKAATEKISQETVNEPTVISTEENSEMRVRQYDSESTVEALRNVASHDPNLALVGFRIEIEKRIHKLAEASGISTKEVSLPRLIGELEGKKIIQPLVASGLMELIQLGNRAAHGTEVTSDAAYWVLDSGPSILQNLEGLEPQ